MESLNLKSLLGGMYIPDSPFMCNLINLFSTAHNYLEVCEHENDLNQLARAKNRFDLALLYIEAVRASPELMKTELTPPSSRQTMPFWKHVPRVISGYLADANLKSSF